MFGLWVHGLRVAAGMTALPYDYGEAKAAIERASVAQRGAEEQVRDAYRQHADAERAYRITLAKVILELHAGGTAWTICPDLARGDPRVADLRYRRDVALGVREAAQSAVFRHTADRRELEQLVNWSLRVAPDGQSEDPATSSGSMRRAA